MNEVVIVSGCRTPIGKFLGGLKDVNSRLKLYLLPY